MLDFLKKKNGPNRIQGTPLSSSSMNENFPMKGKSFLFVYCEKLQKLDSEFSLVFSKLNDSKTLLKSLQDGINERQSKISNLQALNDSTNKITSVFDEFFSQIHIKKAEYLQVCTHISEKLVNINSKFEKPSKDLIIKEDCLKNIKESFNSNEKLIQQLKIDISDISNETNTQKKNITDQEFSKNSLKTTISQHQIEFEKILNELTKKIDLQQQIKEQIDILEKLKKDNNQKIIELQLSISNVNNDISNLDHEIQLVKHTIEEKSYTKLNTHKEALDYERSSIPIKQNLIEISDKCSKTKSLIEQIREESQSIANDISLLNKNIQNHQSISTQNQAAHQNDMIQEARLKGESQANAYRLSETEKSVFQIESEFKIAKEELERLKANEIELKTSFVQKMGEAQHLFADEDMAIRQLTLDINELKVKIDMTKSKQNANKQLEEHLKKNEEEITAISSQNQMEFNNEDSTSSSRQSIIPTILKLKKNKSRFLEIE